MEFDPPAEAGRDVSIEIKSGDLQTLLSDFEVPDFPTAIDEYVCQACGDILQKTKRVQPVGRALLLHLKCFELVCTGHTRGDPVTLPRTVDFGSVTD